MPNTNIVMDESDVDLVKGRKALQDIRAERFDSI